MKLQFSKWNSKNENQYRHMELPISKWKSRNQNRYMHIEPPMWKMKPQVSKWKFKNKNPYRHIELQISKRQSKIKDIYIYTHMVLHTFGWIFFMSDLLAKFFLKNFDLIQNFPRSRRNNVLKKYFSIFIFW